MLRKGEFQRAIEDYNEALEKDEVRQKIASKKLNDRKMGNFQGKILEMEALENLNYETEAGFLRFDEKEPKQSLPMDQVLSAIKILPVLPPQPTLQSKNIELQLIEPSARSDLSREGSSQSKASAADVLSEHEKGYQARQSGDFSAAIRFYTNALLKDPRHHAVVTFVT